MDSHIDFPVFSLDPSSWGPSLQVEILFVRHGFLISNLGPGPQTSAIIR